MAEVIVMKKLLLSVMTAGMLLLASGSAFAQATPGVCPPDGPRQDRTGPGIKKQDGTGPGMKNGQRTGPRDGSGQGQRQGQGQRGRR